MKVDFQWNKSPDQICNDTVGRNDVQLFMANEAKRFMIPYVPPSQKGVLREKNVRVYVEHGKGIVHYLQPYARYQYGGKVMVDPSTGKAAFTDGEGRFWSRKNVKKVLTDRDLHYSNPMATSHWDKAMLAARKEDIARAVQNYIRKKG